MKIAEPAWSEAMGHGEDQSGSRQDRTRGRRRTRMEPGRKGPEGMQGKAEGAQESRPAPTVQNALHGLPEKRKRKLCEKLCSTTVVSRYGLKTRYLRMLQIPLPNIQTTALL